MKNTLLVIALVYAGLTFSQNEIKRAYWADGSLKNIGRLTDYNKTGIWKYFYQNGKLLSVGAYNEGYKIGLWKYYSKSGEYKETYNFDENKDASDKTYKICIVFNTYYYHDDKTFEPLLITEETLEDYQNFYYIPDSKVLNMKCSLVEATNMYFCKTLRVINIDTGIKVGRFCEAINYAHNEIDRRYHLADAKIKILGTTITRPAVYGISIYVDDERKPLCTVQSKKFRKLIIDKDADYFKDKRYTLEQCDCENN